MSEIILIKTQLNNILRIVKGGVFISNMHKTVYKGVIKELEEENENKNEGVYLIGCGGTLKLT